MAQVLLVVHLLIAIALVAVVLVQRSEGGGLGMGGGASSGGGMMSIRGQANFLTRTTAILAAAFMLTSLGLAVLANSGAPAPTIVDEAPLVTGPLETAPTPADGGDTGTGGGVPTLPTGE